MSDSASIDQHQDSIHIAADPGDVYDVVSDVTRTGEWSPVCKECWWVDGDGPARGARFGGRQEVPGRTWETESVVTEADPGNVFAWQVGGRYVEWSYRMQAVQGGTRLTETWSLNDATKQMFAEKYADRADEVLDARRQEALTGIPETLARIKDIVEREV
ncbi:polyketide cyclase [Marmoricola endophyticus]|uniref:Polyketide cyclase n=1 Tax=Marmoricola endophyticus TaxID=2040280 RepID=A0A917BCU9_9ACTN|nr:SRPBCC family protein [Marmoricola endophyticus]GGF37566.1 polyketide cyclase [Marmoricola endophyticus]